MKRMQIGTVATQIKKERLERHLDDVERIIGEWLVQLGAPSPFQCSDGRTWGWSSPYRPPHEQDADNNHILRRHLRTRALWRHHTEWEQRLETIWHLLRPMHNVAEQKMAEVVSSGRQYSEHYLSTALWQAFRLACGQKISISYKPEYQANGVQFGAWVIEGSATAEEYEAVSKEHRHLTYTLAYQVEMGNVVKEWKQVLKLQERMQELVRKALKSSDFLYACRFCKHLWQD